MSNVTIALSSWCNDENLHSGWYIYKRTFLHSDRLCDDETTPNHSCLLSHTLVRSDNGCYKTESNINISTVFGRTLDIATPQPSILSCTQLAQPLQVITHCVHKCRTLSIVFFQKLFENFILSRVVPLIFQIFFRSGLLLTDVTRRKVSCKMAAFDKQCGS